MYFVGPVFRLGVSQDSVTDVEVLLFSVNLPGRYGAKPKKKNKINEIFGFIKIEVD